MAGDVMSNLAPSMSAPSGSDTLHVSVNLSEADVRFFKDLRERTNKIKEQS